MNYFTIQQVIDLGTGFVLLVLDHDYGAGPPVQLPIFGGAEEHVVGSRVEITVQPV